MFVIFSSIISSIEAQIALIGKNHISDDYTDRFSDILEVSSSSTFTIVCFIQNPERISSVSSPNVHR